MKKKISFMLALMMVMCFSMTAFAADRENAEITKSTNVTGTYNATASSVVYSVDISWSDMKFTYNGAYKGKWNPEKHIYESSVEAGWDKNKGTITVTNNSNTDITATPVYNAAEGYDSAKMVFDNESLNVTTADNGIDGNAGHAVTGTIAVSPEGSLPEGTVDAVIGTITISIK